MKFILLTILCASSFSSLTFASSKVDGVWNFESRACSSGKPINDDIKIDEFKMTFRFGYFIAKAKEDGCRYISFGKYKQSANQIWTKMTRSRSSCGQDGGISTGDENTFYLVEGKLVFVLPGGCEDQSDLIVSFKKH